MLNSKSINKSTLLFFFMIARNYFEGMAYVLRIILVNGCPYADNLGQARFTLGKRYFVTEKQARAIFITNRNINVPPIYHRKYINVTPRYAADSSGILGILLRVTKGLSPTKHDSIAESSVFLHLERCHGCNRFDIQNARFYAS